MKIAIRYYTKSGNTKKLADAIAAVTGVTAETVDVPIEGEVDVLFLGSSVYAFAVDEKVTSFINSLDSETVKNVVNFSTAALVPSTYSHVAKLLSAKNIPLDSREFHCRGKFKFMHGSRPDQNDIEAVKAFASQFLAE